MLALSIRQPWASLILKAGKNIENRDWPTKYRGRILIHAAKGMTRGEHEDAIHFAVEAIKADPRNAEATKRTTLRDLGFAFEDLPRGGIVRLARRERERYGRARVRRDEMDLGVPTATGLADSLRTVFFGAPVPSGCTLTLVESSDTASSLICTICARCSCSKARSRTPDLAQRLMRV